MRLYQQLILFMLAATVLPLAVLGFLLLSRAEKGLAERVAAEQRALAVSTAERVAALPEVPTVAELGFPGYDQAEWNGVYGPAGLPAEAVGRIHEACLAALTDAGVQGRLATIGAVGLGTAPDEFAEFLRRERAAMAVLVRETGITAD